MCRRVGVHGLEQTSGLALALGPRGQLFLRRAPPLGERVAQRLELPEAQQARAAVAGNGDVERLAGERRYQRVGKLALEPRDLAAQCALGRVLGCPVRSEPGKLEGEVIDDED